MTIVQHETKTFPNPGSDAELLVNFQNKKHTSPNKVSKYKAAKLRNISYKVYRAYNHFYFLF